MPQSYRILGQLAPSAAVETEIYRVVNNFGCVVSSMVVCNRGVANTTFRISLSKLGAATTDKDYVYYDVPISGNDTFAATLGMTLETNDVVRVYAGNGNLSFAVFGSEIN